MSISLKHKFSSAKADSGDASLIRPSNWNDEHDITLGTAKLIGRYTAGTGSAQEVGLDAKLRFSAGNLALSAAVETQLGDIAGKAPLDSPVFINDPTAPTQPTVEHNTKLATMGAVHNIAAYSVPGYINGMELATNTGDPTNDFDVSPGVCCATQPSPVMIRLTNTIVKRLDAAWSVGNNGGCLDAGAVGNNVYHIFAIYKPDAAIEDPDDPYVDDSITDILASTSVDTPTMPAGYTKSRRLGSIIRVAGANLGFIQNGNDFELKTPPLDVTVSNQGSTAVLRPLTVPTGLKIQAKFRIRATNSSGWLLSFNSPDVTDVAPSAVATPLADMGGAAGEVDRTTINVWTDTSAQIRSRGSVGGTDLQITTLGWIDRRGQ